MQVYYKGIQSSAVAHDTQSKYKWKVIYNISWFKNWISIFQNNIKLNNS